MDWWGWIQDNWIGVYVVGGLLTAAVSALIVFVAVWWFAGHRYALGGLVFGWLPAAVAAVVAGVACGALWPLVVALAIALGKAALDAMDRGEWRG